jgi:hypothetical protein
LFLQKTGCFTVLGCFSKNRILIVCFAVWLFLSVSYTCFAWDGDWTTGVSGDDALFYYDEESKEGKTGTDPPQKYFQPVPRDFADVDPDELIDYFERFNKHYAPHALLRVTRPLHYNTSSQSLQVGYYLIKPGAWGAGSQNMHLSLSKPGQQPTPPNPVQNNQSQAKTGDRIYSIKPEDEIPLDKQPLFNQQPFARGNPELLNNPAYNPPPVPSFAIPSPSSTLQESIRQKEKPPLNVFVVFYNGKVVAVYPIEKMLPYTPARKDKVPSKRPFAWIEMENRQPVLKYYYQKQLYSTVFQ